MGLEVLGVILGGFASVATLIFSYIVFKYERFKEKASETAGVLTRLSVIETKVDLMWTNLQKDMARLIHSPNPERAHIDALMEKIINDEPFTLTEEQEMRDILRQIMMYEPGQEKDLGFPVHPGEQVVAAFLLRSLDYVPIREGSK